MSLYHLFGLAVESEFECPELSEVTPEQAVQRGYGHVRVARADHQLSLPRGRELVKGFWAQEDACLFHFDGIARILVRRPNLIEVEMLPGAPESDMRAYLLGSAFGTLAHMRGLIPLHISAISAPNGAIAFTGPSGAGKSTKVAELHFKHGWRIVCDDVAVINPSDSRPLLYAGFNRIKLWRDTLERFQVDTSCITRDLVREDKFHLNVPGMFEERPVVLRQLEQVDRGSCITTRSIRQNGAMIFTALINAVYRPALAQIFIDRSVLVGNTMKIASLLARDQMRILQD